MEFCPKHPCQCEQCCQPQPLREMCTWRLNALKYLDDHKLQWAKDDGCLTYIQALELMGQETPSSARGRNILNIFARLPATHPLQSTMMIIDIPQDLSHAMCRCDGTVPIIGTTNAQMWTMRAGRLLDVSELAKLMGQDLRTSDLKNIFESRMRWMLGASMHVATAGFALTGLLASVGSSRRV